ncbi:MAG: hypothetical protein HQL32_14775, partial [Planctomycetes bacterium]|nr:hypothetical protein [Planctomycetota bacterium]
MPSLESLASNNQLLSTPNEASALLNSNHLKKEHWAVRLLCAFGAWVASIFLLGFLFSLFMS